MQHGHRLVFFHFQLECLKSMPGSVTTLSNERQQLTAPWTDQWDAPKITALLHTPFREHVHVI